jgi:hypothetical protein
MYVAVKHRLGDQAKINTIYSNGYQCKTHRRLKAINANQVYICFEHTCNTLIFQPQTDKNQRTAYEAAASGKLTTRLLIMVDNTTVLQGSRCGSCGHASGPHESSSIIIFHQKIFERCVHPPLA